MSESDNRSAHTTLGPADPVAKPPLQEHILRARVGPGRKRVQLVVLELRGALVPGGKRDSLILLRVIR